MRYYQDKVIWITGASSGIGEALAMALSAQGSWLILSGRRTAELERVKAACARPDLVRMVPFDLAEGEILGAKTIEAIQAFGHIDIMVHNGGVSSRSLVKDTLMEVQRRVMEIDYFSYVGLTMHLLPHFYERKEGHFVVISSVMGKIGTPKRSAYAAAKHALHGFFDCLRAEVSPEGIRVTIITPGYIRTNVSLNALKGDGSRNNQLGKDIANGYPADRAANQILRAVAAGKFETYVGKPGAEKTALWLNRWAPGLLIKKVTKRPPR
jgi:dehydrogenase/reductase SDR family protein 7B